MLPSAFIAIDRQWIFEQAAQRRLPAVLRFRYFAADGGLLSYGVDVRDLFRRSAAHVDGKLTSPRSPLSRLWLYSRYCVAYQIHRKLGPGSG